MGGRGISSPTSYRGSVIQVVGEDGYGKTDDSGTVKRAIAYHGTDADFSSFDSGNRNVQHNMYGEGTYLASTPETAALYGKHVYKVEVTYSTNHRNAKVTGRTKDYQFSDKTGYWVIPPGSEKNLKIIGVSQTLESSQEKPVFRKIGGK